jgi:hypothetical protein
MRRALLLLTALIKDTGRPVEEIRRLALKMKNAPPFSEAVIQVKIPGAPVSRRPSEG